MTGFLMDKGHVDPAAVVGRKQEKALQLLGLSAQKIHCPTPSLFLFPVDNFVLSSSLSRACEKPFTKLNLNKM